MGKLSGVAASCAAMILLVATARMPYGYYTFSRLSVTVVAIVLIVAAVRGRRLGWVFGLAPIAILWNPIFPVYATRAFWFPLDILAALLFVVLAVVTFIQDSGRRKASL
jgi:hypothetical protein